MMDRVLTNLATRNNLCLLLFIILGIQSKTKVNYNDWKAENEIFFNANYKLNRRTSGVDRIVTHLSSG